jgi:hypothetical protein
LLCGCACSNNGGATWDNGFKNVGISTLLNTHVMGTPLSKNLVVGGFQDNGSRMRVGITNQWNEV